MAPGTAYSASSMDDPGGVQTLCHAYSTSRPAPKERHVLLSQAKRLSHSMLPSRKAALWRIC